MWEELPLCVGNDTLWTFGFKKCHFSYTKILQIDCWSAVKLQTKEKIGLSPIFHPCFHVQFSVLKKMNSFIPLGGLVTAAVRGVRGLGACTEIRLSYNKRLLLWSFMFQHKMKFWTTAFIKKERVECRTLPGSPVPKLETRVAIFHAPSFSHKYKTRELFSSSLLRGKLIN